ncbi:DUF6962 family protein [Dyadobacter sediminis]|uniref:Uncharacterized protein n=1 Tax=Dyadobacter sediminis TaxID=1493691 RepID=A0A5R9KAV5_9BACT|nr:hypothetical protein [Dyadobacter sediminis]TLU91951.1 hypothetical protein FEM55_14395 [Dyadobacter sediminis]GGB98851.1 hypothetical protein GCM10011325_27580 [Dyadobacter sediminis]
MNDVAIDFSKVHQIQVFGITILEPSTVISSLMMTVICIYAFVQLGKLHRTHRMYRQLQYFFLFMGIATAIGGVLGHGFLYMTGMRGKIPGWFASMIAVALMERAAIWHVKPLLQRRGGLILGWLNYVELSIFFVLTFVTLNFLIVEIHAFYGLFLMLFMIEIYVYRQKKDPGSKDVFIATFLGAASAGLHALKFSFGPWFNYNDISHITMGASIWFYYQAARHMIYYGEEVTKPAEVIES